MIAASFSTDPVGDLIAAGVLLTAYLTYRNTGKTKENGDKIDHVVMPAIKDVHALVNQQLTDSEGRRDVAEKENVQLRADAAKETDG